MKNQPSSTKSFLILGVVVAVSALGYFFFMGSSSPETALLQSGRPADPASSNVISLLNQIQELRIDTALFSNPMYKTLRDYSVPIPELNVGRTNPFAPVPGMPSVSPGGGR